MKKHDAEIDKLRGVAILMVILYHAVIVYPVNLHEIAWCRLLHDFLWYMEMPLFFLVAGFCCSYEKGQLGAYLGKKARRLLIPHFAFGLLELLPRVIANPLVHEQLEAGEAVKDLLLYGGGDWFLWTLFLLFLTFPLLQRLYRTGAAGRLLLLPAAVLLYLVSYRMTNLFLLQMWAWFLVYFMIGWYVRQADYERLKASLLQKPWAAACGFAVMLAVFWWNSTHSTGRLLTLTGVLGGAVFFWFAVSRCSGAAERFLLLCGRYSLQMYLLGAYALVVSRTVLVSVLGISQPAAVILLNFVTDAALTLWASKYILERFRPLRIVSGMK